MSVEKQTWIQLNRKTIQCWNFHSSHFFSLHILFPLTWFLSLTILAQSLWPRPICQVITFETHAPLMSMGGWAEGLACTDLVLRTHHCIANVSQWGWKIRPRRYFSTNSYPAWLTKMAVIKCLNHRVLKANVCTRIRLQFSISIAKIITYFKQFSLCLPPDKFPSICILSPGWL